MIKHTHLKVAQTKMETNQQVSEIGFYRLNQVLDIYPVSSTSWWDGIKKGVYPEGVKLSIRTTGWFKKDIHRLVNERAKVA